jgi:uncharacterized protein (DUF486 family)
LALCSLLVFSCFGSFFLSAAASVAPWFDFGSVRSVRSRFKYKFKYTFCWCHVKGFSVGEFAVVGMASFDLVWFEWLRGVQARDCGDSGVVYCARLWLVWCLVAWLLGSIPFNSISVRSGGVCVLAGWLVQSAAR